MLNYLSSFIGRGAELAELERLLNRRRLITLTGMGGCGKTRLAGQVVERVRSARPGAVYAVDLGSVTDDSQVARAVAEAAGIRIEPGADEVRRLTGRLREHEFLLWLDTCEHVAMGVADLSQRVIANCPGGSVLATSRVPLGIAGEATWRVPPLRPHEALLLFGDRAGLVDPGFDLQAAGDAAATVCERLDHLPLAIELAAAWIRVLTPEQIVTGLDDALTLLVGGPRTSVARHRGLAASMTWSHELLSEEERVLFRRLSVMTGPFTLEAVAAVGSEDGQASVSVLPAIARLADASLLAVAEVNGERRYRMLDTVRQYAGELLERAGEAASTGERHCGHYLEVARTAVVGMDEDQERWRRTLDGQRGDVHAALGYGLACGGELADQARDVAAGLSRYWLITGQTVEGLRLLDRALALRPDDVSGTQARLYGGRGIVGIAAGALTSIEANARQGLAIAGSDDDARARAWCLTAGAYPRFFSDFDECEKLAREAEEAATAAEPFFEDWAATVRAYSLVTRVRNREAEELARRVYARASRRQDRFCAAFARGVEIYTAMTAGQMDRALAAGRDARDLIAPLGDFFGSGTLTCNAAQAMAVNGHIAEALDLVRPIVESLDSQRFDVVGYMITYGYAHLWLGNLDEALRWFDTGVARLDERDRDWTAARALPGLVATLRHLRRREEALDWVVRGERMLARFGGVFEHAALLDEHGFLVADQVERARDLHLQALVLRRTAGVRLGYPDSLEALAGLEASEGNAEAAVRLLGTGAAARQAMGYPRPPIAAAPYEDLLARLHSEVGPGGFDAAWADGQAAGLDAVVSALTRGRGARRHESGALGGLTRTEYDVARLVGEGLTNPQIAERLYISRSTVKAHLAHVFSKMGVPNRTALAALVQRETESR